MNTTEMVRFLQPHVSGFSLGFQFNNKHGDDVVLGGKVIRSLDLRAIVDKESDPEGKSDLVYMTLDDGVGEMLIVVPSLFLDEADVEIGDIVLAEGILCEVKKETVFKSKANSEIIKTRDDEPLRLLVKHISKLPLATPVVEK